VLLFLALACKPHDTDPEPVEAVCDPSATRWSAGTSAFTEVTDDWGLTDIAPDGVRLAAVDFDHDGWTDLVVRKGAGVDDFSSGGVRQVWLLKNTGQGRFEDVTQASGLMATRLGTDADVGRPGPTMAFGDVDNDGDLDVYTGDPDAAGATAETSEIMLNDGDGTFSLGPVDSDERLTVDDMPYGAVFVDYDLDGVLDLYTPQYVDKDGSPQQSRLYRGHGDGVFQNLTAAAGMTTAAWSSIATLNAAGSHTESWSGLACDLDNDGFAELMAASYGRAPNHLWHNDGDGSFTNDSVASGYAYDDRTDWTDNESARCWCKYHQELSYCVGVPNPENIACNSDADAFRWDDTYDRELFRLGGNSGATMCADVDNDGWMDLLTTEIVHWDVGSSSDPSEILHNTQAAGVVFERPGNDLTGLTREHDRVDWNDGDMTGSVFDFDNDGWNDVWIGNSDYPGSRGLLWHNEGSAAGDLQFVSVPIADGIDHFRAHGSAIADFDRDGDLDIVVGHSSARCDTDCYPTFVVRMFENQLAGNFVQLELVGGEGTNRSAIGARVEVTAGGITQTHQVDGGHGQLGAEDDLVQHFGLGTACEAEVTVTWPAAGFPTQSFTVPAGHRFRVTQGSNPVVEDP
jgi:hypothetical protein